jgi:hypothetical protein
MFSSTSEMEEERVSAFLPFPSPAGSGFLHFETEVEPDEIVLRRFDPNDQANNYQPVINEKDGKVAPATYSVLSTENSSYVSGPAYRVVDGEVSVFRKSILDKNGINVLEITLPKYSLLTQALVERILDLSFSPQVVAALGNDSNKSHGVNLAHANIVVTKEPPSSFSDKRKAGMRRSWRDEMSRAFHPFHPS